MRRTLVVAALLIAAFVGGRMTATSGNTATYDGHTYSCVDSAQLPAHVTALYCR